MVEFTKVLNPGIKQRHRYFCKIKFENGRLSISAVHGPYKNGNAWGGCGQLMLPLMDTYSPGWSEPLLAQFNSTWERWHLNDMRPGCQHQRESWNPKEVLELSTLRLTEETLAAKRDLLESCLACLLQGESVELTNEQINLLAIPHEKVKATDGGVSRDPQYEVVKTETKTAGWVYPIEHERGLLCKPCSVCRYKYGSEWLYEAVPDDVLVFLQNLPDTTIIPAWI